MSKHSSLCLMSAIIFISMSFHAAAGSPHFGWQSPITVPGTFQAEHYDNGNNGDAYYDLSSGNSGGQMRYDDVDIQVASGGGYNIGWFDTNEWLAYTINVIQPGMYDISAQVASPSGGGSLKFEFTGKTNVNTSTVGFGNTGGWQKLATNTFYIGVSKCWLA